VDEEGREYITPEIERRQHRRAKLVTQIRCEALDREDLMLTRDVSIGGLFITAKNPLPLDSEVTLSFHLAPATPAITCRGKVVYSVRGLGMGIQFFDVSEETRQTLQKFVDESV
jgi:c-di-GMP-binding flagellar brake protein YcgR